MAHSDADRGADNSVTGNAETFDVRRALIERRWRELRRDPNARAWGALRAEARDDVDALLRKQGAA